MSIDTNTSPPDGNRVAEIEVVMRQILGEPA
jgi:hypothetical protein